MALQHDPSTSAPNNSREDTIKSQFMTREGTYKLMTLSEYSRPNRVPFQGNSLTSYPVRVSFVTVKDDMQKTSDRVCFNIGREIYVYHYTGIRKAADLTKPIDKRGYRQICPTCHDFNQVTATNESCSLLIGFSLGQVQIIDPFRKDAQVSILFNDDRIIDKARVTCLKWVPGASKLFLVAHASGWWHLYSPGVLFIAWGRRA